MCNACKRRYARPRAVKERLGPAASRERARYRVSAVASERLVKRPARYPICVAKWLIACRYAELILETRAACSSIVAGA